MITDELITYAQSMQAVGALIHAAIGRDEVEVDNGGARKMREASVGYYRDLGVHDNRMDLETVMTMARELAIWRAAAGVLSGGVVGREIKAGWEECGFVLECESRWR